MILCTAFWINFWPNFVSTTLGLVLGLPIAFWTNKYFNRRLLENTEKIEKERLKKALEIIRETLIENRLKLETTIILLKSDEIQFDTQVDSSAWDVVKSEIIQVLYNPKLKKRLAYHFSWLNSMTISNRHYLDLNTGVNANITGMDQNKASLKIHIINYSNMLIVDLNEIVEMIDIELSKLNLPKNDLPNF